MRPNARHLRLALAALLVSTSVDADLRADDRPESSRASNGAALSFEIVLEPRGRDDHRSVNVSIVVEQTRPIVLGFTAVNTVTGKPFGVYADSIRVTKLKGAPDLLHVAWHDHPEDQERFRRVHYRITRADDPTVELARESLVESGQWRRGAASAAHYSVQYAGDVLTITTRSERRDVSSKPRPLYYAAGIGEPNFYMAVIEQRLSRHYRVQGHRLNTLTGELAYRVQDGDDLSAVCDGLKLEPRWFAGGATLPAAGSWVRFDLPSRLVELRYPVREEPDIW